MTPDGAQSVTPSFRHVHRGGGGCNSPVIGIRYTSEGENVNNAIIADSGSAELLGFADLLSTLISAATQLFSI
ncbi:hypothetical protein NCAST_31_00630 [Nocardia asteroides NBRC 15531]|uniref:Uncharacterized protein n=1 Tax=Nocardia asteroides NBRC 15531 TaxID=1110697 RepID=U5EJR0_NOCAS|nr:hypothetical protein NCAST_31_00630 [Nocardia asteroides NBRC 15531]